MRRKGSATRALIRKPEADLRWDLERRTVPILNTITITQHGLGGNGTFALGWNRSLTPSVYSLILSNLSQRKLDVAWATKTRSLTSFLSGFRKTTGIQDQAAMSKIRIRCTGNVPELCSTLSWSVVFDWMMAVAWTVSEPDRAHTLPSKFRPMSPGAMSC